MKNKLYKDFRLVK